MVFSASGGGEEVKWGWPFGVRSGVAAAPTAVLDDLAI
jgi:hypothetical protein